MVRAPQACSHEESTPPKFSGTDGPTSRLAAGLPNAHYSAWHTGTLESARLQHWDPHSLTLPPSHHARRSDFQMPAASAT